MTSSVASRPGFLRWLVTAGDPATLVATFSTAAGSPVNLSGSTVAAACANWSTSHAGSATVGGASNNEVTVAFTDTITGQLTGGGWTWTLTVDGVTTLAGPLDVAPPGVAGVTGGDASAVVVVDDVNVAVTVTTTGTPGASALNDLTDVDTATDPPDADDVLAWDGVTWTPATLTALGAPGLSNATPADLGTAAAGVSTEASRADHVHDMPTAAQVGALPDNTALLALGETSTTAYRGDRGKTAYDHSQATGNPHGAAVADITGLTSALDGKAAASHSHSGADITSGTVATARLGSGTADSTTFLRGDQTWAAAGGSETLPASIIDAKGDVIVGTAADTAARLAVGADGQVLTADSGEAGGVKWAAAAGGDSVPYVSGNYYSIQGSSPGASATAGLNAAGRLGAHPVYLPAGSFQSIGVNIEVGAVSTWRFGIYPNNPATMTPVGQTLLKDMGTISTNITGIASASSTFTISTAGIYWVATLCDSYTASPQVYGFATGMVPPPALPWLGLTAEAVTSSGFISPLIGALSVTTGAMPATFPALGGSVFRAINYVPLLLVRAA